jgi:hypothetical protein
MCTYREREREREIHRYRDRWIKLDTSTHKCIVINTIHISPAGGRRRRSTGWVLAGVRGFCGMAEGPRVRVLSCAGAYVSGAAGSNACPAGSARIESEAACRTAAVAAGKPFIGVWTESFVPRGCYYDTGFNDARFNTHAVGAGHPSVQPLCATGAPTA